MFEEQSILGKRKLKSEFLVKSIRILPFKKRVLKAEKNGFLNGNFIPNDHIGLVLCVLNSNKSIDITYDNSTKRISYVIINNIYCIVSLYEKKTVVNAFQIQFKNVFNFYEKLIDLYKKYKFISVKDAISDLSQILYIIKIV